MRTYREVLRRRPPWGGGGRARAGAGAGGGHPGVRRSGGGAAGAGAPVLVGAVSGRARAFWDSRSGGLGWDDGHGPEFRDGTCRCDRRCGGGGGWRRGRAAGDVGGFFGSVGQAVEGGDAGGPSPRNCMRRSGAASRRRLWPEPDSASKAMPPTNGRVACLTAGTVDLPCTDGCSVLWEGVRPGGFSAFGRIPDPSLGPGWQVAG